MSRSKSSTAQRRWREVSTVAVGGLIIAVIALTPQQWGTSISSWTAFLSIHWLAAVSGLTGLGAGVAMGMYVAAHSRRALPAILSGNEYSTLFRTRVEAGEFTRVKVFGYTGETVLNDLLRFEDRYNAHLEVRLLHRNWLREAADERDHNARPSTHSTMPWDKARAIRTTALAPWPHAMLRTIKYYDGPPCVKGVILCASEHGPREAFVSFYEWLDPPPGGGSPFKASGMAIMYLGGKTLHERDLIRYLESQFDLIWSRSKTVQEVIGEEDENAVPKATRG